MAHYQNGVSERVNRTIRERAALLVQEPHILGQISKIIKGRTTELLRTTKIPERLWPEAVRHAIWLKNRSLARALRKKEKKTLQEALYNTRPNLERERIWGSRAYIAYSRGERIPAQKGRNQKLHSLRGWMGYYVGYKSELIYWIYSLEDYRVKQVGVARVDDSEGTEDPQDAPSLHDRVDIPEIEIDLQDEAESYKSGDESESSESKGEPENPKSKNDVTEDQSDNLL